ncbi:MAG: low specificity L-threonine aldolase [Ktedonobacteraceae bacterium]|nr:low specificity L-threonine aldolase [Ktedonobacteraceae bacterium]MBO0792206.1 low specificity L-threonine aldolase [Ktedonobacteraceae bacterium]
MDVRDPQVIYRACTHFLSHHYRKTPQQTLLELAENLNPQLEADRYGSGSLINDFEAEIATLLGKEAAVFMPSGTMCQQIALRIWSERRGTRNIAFHPLSHLEIHEHQAYQRLHNLNAILVGDKNRLLGLDDVKAANTEPLGALLLELPQRELGGILPTWDELVAISSWARERQIPLHLDGARLWECKPFYQRSYAEIAGLFDSVYVSFYKILGGLAGSVLTGPADLIAEARIWQRRHGGNLIQLYPYVLSAQKGLNDHLERIETYCIRAREIAKILSGLPQIDIVPDPPHTNMMHVFIHGDRDRLLKAFLDVSEETSVWLTGGLMSTPLPTLHKFELTVGEATLDLSCERIEQLFKMVIEKAA